MIESNECRELILRAQQLRVSSPPTREDAASLWSLLRSARKQAEAKKDEQCRPLKEAWEQAKRPYDEFIKECVHWEAELQRRMAAYDRELERRAAEEQARLAAKVEAQNQRRLARAEAKGLDPSAVVLAPPPVVPEPPRTITTQAGTKQVRVVKRVWEVVDTVSLMRDMPLLFVVDHAKLQAAGRAGMLDGREDVRVLEQYEYRQVGGDRAAAREPNDAHV